MLLWGHDLLKCLDRVLQGRFHGTKLRANYSQLERKPRKNIPLKFWEIPPGGVFTLKFQKLWNCLIYALRHTCENNTVLIWQWPSFSRAQINSFCEWMTPYLNDRKGNHSRNLSPHFYQDTVLPEAVTYWSKALRVIRTENRIRLSRWAILSFFSIQC